MLKDTVIQFFQSLFDGINGLQDPLLGQRLSFKVARNPFIHILHDGQCHWVIVRTFGCDPGEINYYDSLFKGKLRTVLKNKFAIYYTQKEIRLKCMLCLCNNKKTILPVAYTQSPLLIL